MKRCLFLILFIVLILNCGETPDTLVAPKFDKGAPGTALSSTVVHNFEDTYNPNLLDGYTGCGAGNGDAVTNDLTYLQFNSGVRSLKVIITHDKIKEGYIWMAFNFGPEIEKDAQGNNAPQKRDVSGYKYISFFINIVPDRVKFYVEMGDISLPTGQSVKVPVTVIRKFERWQEVRILLEDFKGLDLERVNKLIFSMNSDIETQSRVDFYLDDIIFKN